MEGATYHSIPSTSGKVRAQGKTPDGKVHGQEHELNNTLTDCLGRRIVTKRKGRSEEIIMKSIVGNRCEPINFCGN